MKRNNKEPYFKYTPLTFPDTFTRHVGIDRDAFGSRGTDPGDHPRMTQSRMLDERRKIEQVSTRVLLQIADCLQNLQSDGAQEETQKNLWMGRDAQVLRDSPRRGEGQRVIKPGFVIKPPYSSRTEMLAVRRAERPAAPPATWAPTYYNTLPVTFNKTVGQVRHTLQSAGGLWVLQGAGQNGPDFEAHHTEGSWSTTLGATFGAGPSPLAGTRRNPVASMNWRRVHRLYILHGCSRTCQDGERAASSGRPPYNPPAAPRTQPSRGTGKTLHPLTRRVT